jgi:hypothetical protein
MYAPSRDRRHAPTLTLPPLGGEADRHIDLLASRCGGISQALASASLAHLSASPFHSRGIQGPGSP